MGATVEGQPQARRWARRGPRVFTLIELLVVIAIIAILASMLMPSLGKARDAGKAVVCKSNLKQMSLGMLSYMTDTGGWLPGGIYGMPPAGQTTYYLEVMRQVGADLSQFPDTLAIWNNSAAWMRIAQIQLCPVDQAWGASAPYGSYGMNQPGWDYYKRPTFGGVFTNTSTYFNFASVKRPADTVKLSEMLHHGWMPAMDATTQTANVWDPVYEAGGWLSARHFHPGGRRVAATSGGCFWEGSNNYLFFDGHVESRVYPPYSFGNPIPVGSALPTYSTFVQ
jgi:prepilin-type N-terminal cleavage/methylation domain-containing protein/prepilin-type processing-associated H-X9-DG protein